MPSEAGSSGNAVVEYHVTFGNAGQARTLARAVLEARLAACANIFQGVRSLYWWQGEIAEENEVSVLFKTSTARAEALATFIAERHPYDTPAIIRHDGGSANAAFARWIEEETTPS